ncbi:MAG: hypothetical protein AB1521_12300 [Bacteroidota bacterium]
MNRYLLLALLPILLHCSDGTPVEDNLASDIIPFPAIRDSIPYSKIGIGKIVFERIGPENNNYSGVCVLDSENQNAIGFQTACDAPSISPSGNRVAFSENSGTSPWSLDIYVSSLDGTSKKNISNIAGQDRCPNWSYDGSNVYFWVINQVTNYALLYRIKPDNLSDKEFIHEFTLRKPSTPFSESVDNKLIYSDGGTIYLLDNSEVKVFLAVDFEQWGSIYTPCWSPDGKLIAFLQAKKKVVSNSILNFGGKVMLYDPGSNVLTTVYEWTCGDRQKEWYGFNTLSLCWSPDGTRLAFNQLKEGYESHIYIVNKDGTGLTQITNAPGVCDRSVTWSRD